MAATLTADPNPVGLWDLAATKSTRVKWSTDSNNRGKVHLRIDGADQGPVDGGVNGAFDGDFNYPVGIGRTYVFTLRRVGGNQAVLATLVVTAYDLQKELLDQTVGAILFANQLDPPQAIYDLVVSPGVDTVRVSFRTRRPAIPFVGIETLDGEQVASWFPFGALRTRHAVEFGLETPIAQGTKHRVRIAAPGGKSLVDPAKDLDVVRIVEFETGTRFVGVNFDQVKVLKDGDPWPWGAGEFKFNFYAQDASAPNNWGSAIFERDIDQDEPAVDVEVVVPLFIGPREVLVSIRGRDYDFELPAPGQGIDLLPWPSGRAGTRFDDNLSGPTALVWQTFDVSDVRFGEKKIDFKLATGDFKVAFVIDGFIDVNVEAGLGWWMIPAGYRVPKVNVVVLKEAGAKGTMSGKHGAGTLLALDGERRTWQRAIDPKRPESRPEGWSPLAAAPGGAVTGLRLEDGRTALFGLAADGAAMRWLPDEGGREGRWRPLGGRFRGALAAVEGAGGQIALFGVGEDNRIWQRALGMGMDPSAEWEDLGGAIAGNLLALAWGEDAALLAIDRAGHVVHRMAQLGGDPRWRPLGGPKVGWLVAWPADDSGIMLAGLTEEGVVHRLHWRDHPHGEPERAWEELGPLEALMPLQPLPPRPTKEPAAAEAPPTAA